MREIKFRAWDKQRKVMENCISINPFYITDCDRRMWKHKEVELMQYTGLHDDTEDEVEIFEFDYVEFEYEGSTYKGLIKFEGGCFIIGCNELPDNYIPMFEIAEFDREYSWINGRVIGNKFDNPELMKESEDNEM